MNWSRIDNVDNGFPSGTGIIGEWKCEVREYDIQRKMLILH